MIRIFIASHNCSERNWDLFALSPYFISFRVKHKCPYETPLGIIFLNTTTPHSCHSSWHPSICNANIWLAYNWPIWYMARSKMCLTDCNLCYPMPAKQYSNLLIYMVCIIYFYNILSVVLQWYWRLKTILGMFWKFALIFMKFRYINKTKIKHNLIYTY